MICIFQHRTSGDRYAVEIEPEFETIVSAAGPLHYAEIKNALRDGFNNDQDLADEMAANDSWYIDITERVGKRV